MRGKVAASKAATGGALGDQHPHRLDRVQRDAAGPTATVVANRPWVVSVVGNTGAFTCAGAGCNGTKTAADLKWEVNGAGGSFANNMSTPSDLASGNATSGTSAQIMYRTLWSVANDTPGTYSLVVNFTLSAP